MYIFRLVIRSLINRGFTSFLTLISVMLSVTLFIGVERVRRGARESFTNTISQTDLIVGAKGGTIQLLLYTVFRMGTATANISYETYLKFKNNPDVAWTIPYSLGDAHKGYRVVATDETFYKHYRYRRDTLVAFSSGSKPNGVFDVTLGSEVASHLGYKIGDKITLSHGTAEISLQNHDDKPFTVVGILAHTATPIDRSLYITLQGMEAIHIDWQDGAPPMPGEEAKAEDLIKQKLETKVITAFLLGAKSRIDTLRLQRMINDYTDEPLMAIIPGVALSELWDGISYAEDGLRIVSGFVVIVGLLGMLIAIYNTLNERRREMAILRSVGAPPKLIFGLLISESMLLTLVGSTLGVVTMYVLLWISQKWVSETFGFYLPITPLSWAEWCYLGVIVVFGFLLGLIPATRAYRNTLSDGLTIRI